MKAAKIIEISTNLSIILVSLLLGATLVKYYLLPAAPAGAGDPRGGAGELSVGAQVPLPGADWPQSERTLLMVLSANCRYCTESAEFYRRLAQERTNRPSLRLLAVMPHEIEQGRSYLEGLGVRVDEVMRAPAGTPGVRGTPTLILVDNQGVARNIWVGKLTTERESEVLNLL